MNEMVTMGSFSNCAECRFGGHIDWSEFAPSDHKQFSAARIPHTHRRAETIFIQDDEPNGIYCVASGYVLLWRIDAFGNQTALGLVGPGEIMGYRSFFAEERHAATARALTECRVCLVPTGAMRSLLDTNPAMARRFLRTLARDPGPPDALLLRAHHVPAHVRLVSLLLILRDRFAATGPSDSAEFNLPITRRDIAALLGARPETVARAIRELEDDGLAIFDGRHVAVPDLAQLYQMSGTTSPPETRKRPQ